MKRNMHKSWKLFKTSLLTLLLAGLLQAAGAQSISVYQYRQVPSDKSEEFIKRETTYWSKVAKKAIADGKLQFWALLEKVGGDDMLNSPNYLFINTFKDIDAANGDMWNPSTIFPKVPLSQIETGSMSKVTGMFFFRDENWEQSSKAAPEKDFKFIVFNFANSSDPTNFIALEKKHWEPFIKKAMDNDQTSQRAWGNASLLSPTGETIKFNTVSYDLFPNLREALLQRWNTDVVFPNDGLTELNKLELNRRTRAIYRIVMVADRN